MGDMDRERDMISASKENGADFVKFQTWSVSRLKRGPWDDDGRLEIYKEAELTREKHIELLEFSNKIGIPFFTSVFSIPDAELLHSLEVDTVKIASAESRNKELLKFCDGVFKTIYISTGTSTIEEVEQSIGYLSKAEIVLELIPKSLKTQLYKAIRDSFASEHGARMTAMHKATDNATELRDDLLLTYNKARQAAITNEILEIVGGAEALNN